jgi:hypothetical protein
MRPELGVGQTESNARQPQSACLCGAVASLASARKKARKRSPRKRRAKLGKRG